MIRTERIDTLLAGPERPVRWVRLLRTAVVALTMVVFSTPAFAQSVEDRRVIPPPAPPISTGGTGLPFFDATDECPGYPREANGVLQLQAAAEVAKASGRRVLLDLGSNDYAWCTALCELLRRPEFAAVIARGYVHLKADVGFGERNLDLLRHIHVPNPGTPSFAILDGDGKVLHYQLLVEFEGRPGIVEFLPERILDFLLAWSPPPAK